MTRDKALKLLRLTAPFSLAELDTALKTRLNSIHPDFQADLKTAHGLLEAEVKQASASLSTSTQDLGYRLPPSPRSMPVSTEAKSVLFQNKGVMAAVVFFLILGVYFISSEDFSIRSAPEVKKPVPKQVQKPIPKPVQKPQSPTPPQKLIPAKPKTRFLNPPGEEAVYPDRTKKKSPSTWKINALKRQTKLIFPSMNFALTREWSEHKPGVGEIILRRYKVTNVLKKDVHSSIMDEMLTPRNLKEYCKLIKNTSPPPVTLGSHYYDKEGVHIVSALAHTGDCPN